jgi:hypothetical protein
VGGIAVPIIPFFEAYGLAWIAEHIVEVSVVCAVSGALSLAAVVWLKRWSDRRDARRRGAGPLLYVRSEQITVPARQHTPIAPTYTFNFYGADSDTAARVFEAIPGNTGDATITERELTHGTAPHPHPRTA